jgi:hypothetical protein
MGCFIPYAVPCAKGPIPYCLEEVSKGRNASARLKKLAGEIKKLAPHYRGLETVFDTHLVAHVIKNAAARKGIAAHLKKNWFDDTSADAYFEGPVAAIYAEGVLKAINLCLKGKSPVPLNAWWFVDAPSVKMLTLVEVRKGLTVGGRVTLIVQTPRPRDEVKPGTVILGDAHAWVTEQAATGALPVTTREIPKKTR